MPTAWTWITVKWRVVALADESMGRRRVPTAPWFRLIACDTVDAMTIGEIATTSRPADAADDGTDGGGQAPRRPRLAIFGPETARPAHDTPMMRPPTVDDAAGAVKELSAAGGSQLTLLFGDPESLDDGGFSLVYATFGPNFTVPRHSHSVDCLYYILKGGALLGNRVILDRAGASSWPPTSRTASAPAPPAWSSWSSARAACSTRGPQDRLRRARILEIACAEPGPVG